MLRFLQLVYLMLPVYLANMAPPFVKYWRGWNRPISRRWLGDHKTVIGFALGVAVAVAVTLAQSRINWAAGLVNYDQWLALGFSCGCGALGGDALKSFIKRRLGIAPGQSWIPADQLDFVVGGLVGLSFFVALDLTDVIVILVASLVGDIVVNHMSFQLGIRDTKW
jgi:CDP-2,3-bis-(O-geranylgeranyl)-sn-glycerol synthase